MAESQDKFLQKAPSYMLVEFYHFEKYISFFERYWDIFYFSDVKQASFMLKVNESRYKPCRVTPNFSTGQNPFQKLKKKVNIDTINWEKFFLPRKIYWKKYWRKMNIDRVNWEKIFDRSAKHK